jgi:hypothetical protein
MGYPQILPATPTHKTDKPTLSIRMTKVGCHFVVGKFTGAKASRTAMVENNDISERHVATSIQMRSANL